MGADGEGLEGYWGDRVEDVAGWTVAVVCGGMDSVYVVLCAMSWLFSIYTLPFGLLRVIQKQLRIAISAESNITVLPGLTMYYPVHAMTQRFLVHCYAEGTYSRHV